MNEDKKIDGVGIPGGPIVRPKSPTNSTMNNSGPHSSQSFGPRLVCNVTAFQLRLSSGFAAAAKYHVFFCFVF